MENGISLMPVDNGAGVDADSFGQGWAAATALFTALGAFLWKVVGGAKAAQIRTLEQRIVHLESDRDSEREQCRRDIAALNTRINVLEALTLGAVSQASPASSSEIGSIQGR